MADGDQILESVEPVTPRDPVPYLERKNAMLCLGCDAIYPAESNDCPRCHSAIRFPVAQALKTSAGTTT